MTYKPPYYAVIFTTELKDEIEDYHLMADKILELAKQQPGYLGFETARDTIGISVSYWKDLDAIYSWSKNLEHIKAKEKGKSTYYKNFKTRICKVEREY